jgi:hypothetical protein
VECGLLQPEFDILYGNAFLILGLPVGKNQPINVVVSYSFPISIFSGSQVDYE